MLNRLTAGAIALSLSTLSVAPSAAQPLPPLRLDVRITPAVTPLEGGRSRVTYTVENGRGSRDSLFRFIVDRPVETSVVAASSQPGARELLVLRRYGTGDIAAWIALDPLVGPGDRLVGLSVEGPGIAGPVRYWVSREAPPDTLIDENPGDTPMLDEPPVTADTDTGWTVGIVPPPSDLTRTTLTSVLKNQLAFSCRLGWVSNQGVCRSLDAKIAAGSFQALLNELDAQRGKQISETAYAMLATNVRILLGLPAS